MNSKAQNINNSRPTSLNKNFTKFYNYWLDIIRFLPKKESYILARLIYSQKWNLSYRSYKSYEELANICNISTKHLKMALKNLFEVQNIIDRAGKGFSLKAITLFEDKSNKSIAVKINLFPKGRFIKVPDFIFNDESLSIGHFDLKVYLYTIDKSFNKFSSPFDLYLNSATDDLTISRNTTKKILNNLEAKKLIYIEKRGESGSRHPWRMELTDLKNNHLDQIDTLKDPIDPPKDRIDPSIDVKKRDLKNNHRAPEVAPRLEKQPLAEEKKEESDSFNINNKYQQQEQDIKRVLQRNKRNPDEASDWISYFNINPKSINPLSSNGKEIKSIPAVLEIDFKSKLRIYHDRFIAWQHEKRKKDSRETAINLFGHLDFFEDKNKKMEALTKEKQLKFASIKEDILKIHPELKNTNTLNLIIKTRLKNGHLKV